MNIVHEHRKNSGLDEGLSWPIIATHSSSAHLAQFTITEEQSHQS